MLQRLLLLPLLAPLLLVLLIAALNPSPSYGMRLLIWRLPPLPLGAWIAMAAGGGAAFSAGFAALALQQAVIPLRRARDEQSFQPPPPPSRRQRPAPPPGVPVPERAPQDPLPTISIPFRVIRRTEAAAPSPTGPITSGLATPVGEGWEDLLREEW
ncbi:hypothetical protein KQ313_08365 [Synechococcus sp. CS-1325]|uniref:hypothetical protein n=1 Tax=Synechococcus sp. CS-1325 TaxID=2847979 RepID=UPI000DB2F1EE|nr:hypothetical protein [Synechococcus sp. CS-1325]MCT0199689.1 hypothetical protein [Synechococcus sp. CS-1325]PZV01006.1 MAG: hypothetical protein DCF24_05570 [Cyanobium sp.]